MAVISLFSLYSTASPVTLSPESHLSAGIFLPEINLRLRTSTLRDKTLRVHSSNSSKGKPNNDEFKSRFLNEDGVVEDMDGYLNYLSLEYDSVWDTKPAW